MTATATAPQPVGTATRGPIRVACVADNQVDERSRLEEHDRVMAFVAEDAKERGCSLMLHGGDVFERKSTVRERRSVNDWLAACYPMPVVIAGGNHETPGEVVELAGQASHLLGAHRAHTEAFERPGGYVAGDCIVAVLPWPRIGWLAAHLLSEGERKSLSREELRATAKQALDAILLGFRERLLAHPGPRILLAHWTPVGYSVDPDQPTAPIGDAMALSPADLASSGADVVIGGHIHMPQDWRAAHAVGDWQVPVIQCGSPRRTAFAKGELVEKGYVVLEFGQRSADGQMALSWERVPTPATPMVLIEAEYDPVPESDAAPPALAFRWGYELRGIPNGAEIRFRYTVDAAQRANAKAVAEELRADWLEQGALSVKIEPVTRVAVEARVPEVAQVSSTPDKLRALWAHRGDQMTEADTKRVLGRLGELRMEVTA